MCTSFKYKEKSQAKNDRRLAGLMLFFYSSIQLPIKENSSDKPLRITAWENINNDKKIYSFQLVNLNRKHINE